MVVAKGRRRFRSWPSHIWAMKKERESLALKRIECIKEVKNLPGSVGGCNSTSKGTPTLSNNTAYDPAYFDGLSKYGVTSNGVKAGPEKPDFAFFGHSAPASRITLVLESITAIRDCPPPSFADNHERMSAWLTSVFDLCTTAWKSLLLQVNLHVLKRAVTHPGAAEPAILPIKLFHYKILYTNHNSLLLGTRTCANQLLWHCSTSSILMHIGDSWNLFAFFPNTWSRHRPDTENWQGLLVVYLAV